MLLADEPTGALDSKTGMEVLNMMEELNRAGQTIVLITHDMEVAVRASRTVIIRDGVLTEQERGAGNETFARPQDGNQECLIQQA